MSRRGRRVPEAAPLVGLVLGFSAGLFGYLFAPPGALLPVLLVAVVLFYGFTVYGVVRSPDPTAVLRPDPVLAGGVLLAGLLGGYGLVVAHRPALALFAALVAVVPPALYHARYGERVNPLSPDATLAVAVVAGLLVAAGGSVLVADPALAVLDAVVIVLAGTDYRDARGRSLPRTLEAALVAATLGGAVLSVLYLALVAGRPVVGLLVGAALLVVGSYFAMGEEGPRRG